MEPAVTNKAIRFVASLDERKRRRREGAFKAEGTKCVLDTLPYFTLRALYATPEWIDAHPAVSDRAIPAQRGEIVRMSSLSTPSDVIAVYDIPERTLPEDSARTNLVLALDTIQDPGNLGTIIRLADWYGITHIICSRETADCYAPKVIQATMGSISRISVHYGDLAEMFSRLSPENIYGTFLEGENIDRVPLASQGIIVIGNEGNGISPEIERLVTRRLTIPSYPPERPTGESLNAAIATAITVSKFRSSR